MGSHLIIATSLELTQSPVFGFCYAQNQVGNTVVINAEYCHISFPVSITFQAMESQCIFLNGWPIY